MGRRSANDLRCHGDDYQFQPMPNLPRPARPHDSHYGDGFPRQQALGDTLGVSLLKYVKGLIGGYFTFRTRMLFTVGPPAVRVRSAMEFALCVCSESPLG